MINLHDVQGKYNIQNKARHRRQDNSKLLSLSTTAPGKGLSNPVASESARLTITQPHRHLSLPPLHRCHPQRLPSFPPMLPPSSFILPLECLPRRRIHRFSHPPTRFSVVYCSKIVDWITELYIACSCMHLLVRLACRDLQRDIAHCIAAAIYQEYFPT